MLSLVEPCTNIISPNDSIVTLQSVRSRPDFLEVPPTDAADSAGAENPAASGVALTKNTQYTVNKIEITAGTLNTASPLVVLVEEVGNNTRLSHIVKLLDRAL